MRVTHSVCRRSSPGLADEMEAPSGCPAFEYLGRTVDRPVVGGDEEVDACAQMVRDLGVHDVGLVADEQRHHELHRRWRLERQVDAALRQLDSLVRPGQAQRSVPDSSMHREQRELRAVRAECAPLRHAIAQTDVDGIEGRATPLNVYGCSA